VTALDRDYCTKWGTPPSYPTPPPLHRHDRADVTRAILADMRRAEEAERSARLQAGIAAQRA